MPRVACGNLLIDVAVPDSFRCAFSLSGSMLAESADGGFELSVLTVQPRAGAARSLVEDLLTRDGPGARLVREGLAVQRRDETTTVAAFDDTLLIATHEPALAATVEEVLTSVDHAHDPFGPPTEHPQSCPIRESHRPWFEQRRRALAEALGWNARLPAAAQKLDDAWEVFVASPPDDEDELAARLASMAVGVGDLLLPLGFEWSVICDAWGTTLGMVALRDTAHMVVVPDSFVRKRWESREPRFIEEGVEAIRENLERFRAGWPPN